MKFTKDHSGTPVSRAVSHALTGHWDKIKPKDGTLEVTLLINGVEVEPIGFYEDVDKHISEYIDREAVALIKKQAEKTFDKLIDLTNEMDEMQSEFKESLYNKFKEHGFEIYQYE